ncbi:MAG: hypothetical protein H7329_18895 [Opitutaceae bacterium]|nr:hypothetical protein [Cytophagales bacterium]
MKYLLVYTFFLFFPFFIQAQDDMKLVKDGIIMREGKVYKIDKDGTTTLVVTESDLGNGTHVSRNGDITWPGGVKTKLKEGEIILKSGGLGILQSRVKQLNGFIFKDGKMCEISPTTLRTLETERVVADSNRIKPDGKYYIGKGDRFIQIRENEVVTLAGEILIIFEDNSFESYVIKRDAVVIKSVNSKMGIVDVDYLFPNGTKVNAQGLVTTKEGLSFSLHSGEKLNSKGELFLSNDGLFSNGLIKKDGLVYLVKEGKVSALKDDYVQDTTRVSTKGIITYSSKPEKFVMKEGDVVSLDGKLMVASSGCTDKSTKERFIIDHIAFKEGKLFIIKDAESSLLTKEIILSDGSKILKTGHIIKANGSKIQLHDGQRIALTGDELPDEKPEETTNPDKNYITMLKGRMWLVTDGKPGLLKEDYNIKGKMIVKIDGFVQKSDGSKIVLKENDRLSLDGILIPVDKRQLPGQLPIEYYIMKNGKMWMVHEGKPTKLDKDIVTAEGTKIYLDGNINKKDKNKFVLKEGEKIDTRGEILSAK